MYKLNVNANRMKFFWLKNIQRCFESRIFTGATEKLPRWEKPHAKTMSWSDMECHAKKVRWKILWVGTQKRQSTCTKSQLPAWMIITLKEELESVGELSKMCSQNCLEMLVFGTSWYSHKMDRSLCHCSTGSAFSIVLTLRLILLETLRTLNQPRCESYAFSEVEHSFP